MKIQARARLLPDRCELVIEARLGDAAGWLAVTKVALTNINQPRGCPPMFTGILLAPVIWDGFRPARERAGTVEIIDELEAWKRCERDKIRAEERKQLREELARALEKI